MVLLYYWVDCAVKKNCNVSSSEEKPLIFEISTEGAMGAILLVCLGQ